LVIDLLVHLVGEGEAPIDRVRALVAPDGGRDWHHDLPVREFLLEGDRLFAGDDVVVAVGPDGTVVWRDRGHGKWLLLNPDSDSLYTRSGVQADAATAYDTTGDARWTFDRR
jgi:hypothetical protein